MPLKKGLNRQDQNKLKMYVAKGFRVEKIAYALNTTVDVIQVFIQKPKKKTKPKKIAADKKPDNPGADVTSTDA